MCSSIYWAHNMEDTQTNIGYHLSVNEFTRNPNKIDARKIYLSLFEAGCTWLIPGEEEKKLCCIRKSKRNKSPRCVKSRLEKITAHFYHESVVLVPSADQHLLS